MLYQYIQLICVGTTNSMPSQLQKVCVGQARSRLNISWDLLPCHLQNGADISDYIIQYHPTSRGEAENVSSTDERVGCRQFGDHYSCLSASTFLTFEDSYTIQVAAINIFGIGAFSEVVNRTGHSLGTYVSF